MLVFYKAYHFSLFFTSFIIEISLITMQKKVDTQKYIDNIILITMGKFIKSNNQKLSKVHN